MIYSVMDKMIGYFGTDARRINHALKVYGFASLIAGNEKLAPEICAGIGYAALLHDIGISEAERKYNSSAGTHQEREGPPVARAIMEPLGLDAKTIERTCFIIGHHHSYSFIDGIDFQILVEADFLVNIFEDEFESAAIEAAGKNIFRTESGLALLKSMYGWPSEDLTSVLR